MVGRLVVNVLRELKGCFDGRMQVDSRGRIYCCDALLDAGDYFREN